MRSLRIVRQTAKADDGASVIPTVQKQQAPAYHRGLYAKKNYLPSLSKIECAGFSDAFTALIFFTP